MNQWARKIPSSSCWWGKEERKRTDCSQWTNLNVISNVLFALYMKKSKANTIK